MTTTLPYHCLLPVTPEKCPMNEKGFVTCPHYMYCGTIEINGAGELWIAGLGKLGLSQPNSQKLKEIENHLLPLRMLAKLTA